jgi:hypothetical protein
MLGKSFSDPRADQGFDALVDLGDGSRHNAFSGDSPL